MDKEVNAKKKNKTKGFFTRLVEKVDRKMEEKAKKSSCSYSSAKNGDNSCCS